MQKMELDQCVEQEYIMFNGCVIQSKQVANAVQFNDPLKRLKLKTLATDVVIKKDNDKTIPLLSYFKLHTLQPLVSALILM